ncbi:MAG: hypothetical protein H6898_09195 [Rhodobacter sp.]|nr:hypothetical protein [Paracoccaceae bacterium]MCC0076745.1 hypothetical protein [Rhodobacter sp.]
MIPPVAGRAMAAYGGADRWARARRFTAEVSAHGLAFTIKRRPAFVQARVEGAVHRPLCRLTPIGARPDVTGVIEGPGVRLEDAQGSVLERRDAARAGFPYGRRTLRWDDLDMAYFANYAFWGYFTLPALLANPTIAWTETGPHRLRATFPPGMPVHCRQQDYAFDPDTGLLARNDYTAEVIGGWARAANVVTEHRDFDGLPVAARRRVTPRGPFGTALPGPLLIGITVHAFALHDD